MMKKIKLLCTDFDGTLVGKNPKEVCSDALALELEQIECDATLWCINTGRPLFYLLEGLEHFQAPIKPHYIITRERYLFHYDEKKGWSPLGTWNERCDKEHQELFEASAPFFEKLEPLISEYGEKIRVFKNDIGLPEAFVSEEEAIIDEIAERLLELPHRSDDFLFQRSASHKDNFLGFYHRLYSKGTTLEELSRFLSISADHVLAIGDHDNDLSMLHHQVAKMIACPSNAHPSVKAAVEKARGHVSRHPAGEGTAEAISLYRQGKL